MLRGLQLPCAEVIICGGVGGSYDFGNMSVLNDHLCGVSPCSAPAIASDQCHRDFDITGLTAAVTTTSMGSSAETTTETINNRLRFICGDIYQNRCVLNATIIMVNLVTNECSSANIFSGRRNKNNIKFKLALMFI